MVKHKLYRLTAVLLSALLAFGLMACTKEKESSEEAASGDDYRTVFSEEVADWLDWFNDLSYEDQLAISYRPFEVYEYLQDGTKTLLNELRNIIAVDYGRLSGASGTVEGKNASSGSNVKSSGTYAVSVVGEKLPVGGFEKSDDAAFYNKSDKIDRANCYSYSLDFFTESTVLFTQQPGFLAGSPITMQDFSKEGFSGIIEAVKKDLPYIESAVEIRPCQENDVPGPLEYKAALVIAPGRDYHWYRQNPDGTWSHKRGHQEISRQDASGNTIYAPHLCDRDYGKYNYSCFAGYYLVKYGNTFSEAENIVLNSETYELMGRAKSLMLTEDHVYLEYAGNTFDFEMEPYDPMTGMGDSEAIKAYCGVTANLECMLEVYPDCWGLQIVSYREQADSRKNDPEHNFIVFAGEGAARQAEKLAGEKEKVLMSGGVCTVVNAFAGNRIGTAENVQLTTEEVRFTLRGKDYAFDMKKAELPVDQDLQGMEANYLGVSEQQMCSLMVWPDHCFVQVSAVNEHADEQQLDEEHNFLIITGENIEERWEVFRKLLSER